jgi:hypothetical protein
MQFRRDAQFFRDRVFSAAPAAVTGPAAGGNFALSAGLSKLKPEWLSNTGAFGVRHNGLGTRTE